VSRASVRSLGDSQASKIGIGALVIVTMPCAKGLKRMFSRVWRGAGQEHPVTFDMSGYLFAYLQMQSRANWLRDGRLGLAVQFACDHTDAS